MSQKKKSKSPAEDHALYAPHVLDAGSSLAASNVAVLDDPRFEHRVLATGDDWFRLDRVPGGALLPQIEFRQPTLIVYADDSDLESIAPLLAPERRPGFDLVLLSVGLRELLAGLDGCVLSNSREEKNPLNALDIKRLKQTLGVIQSQIERIAALRGRKIPLLAHTYDYLTPRAATLAGAPDPGPWLDPVMQRCEIVPKLQVRIADYVIESLAEAIKALRDSLREFHAVDTLGTLVRADAQDAHSSGDWLSEIHPNPRGLRKFASALQPRIHKLLK